MDDQFAVGGTRIVPTSADDAGSSLVGLEAGKPKQMPDSCCIDRRNGSRRHPANLRDDVRRLACEPIGGRILRLEYACTVSDFFTLDAVHARNTVGCPFGGASDLCNAIGGRFCEPRSARSHTR